MAMRPNPMDSHSNETTTNHLSREFARANCTENYDDSGFVISLQLKCQDNNVQSLYSEQLILVTGGYDHTIKIWEAVGGSCIRTVQHPESVNKHIPGYPD